MTHVFVLGPVPAGLGPQTLLVVPTRAHEVEELGVRDVVSVDGEGGYLHHVRLKLVIPAEVFLVLITGLGTNPAQGSRAGRNLHHPRSYASPRRPAKRRLRNLSVEWNLMEHVGESLGMHQAMLERNLQANAVSSAGNAL